MQPVSEARITCAALAATASASALLLYSIGTVAWTAFEERQINQLFESLLFGCFAGFLVYGNLCYQIARIGQWKRIYEHRLSSQYPVIYSYETAPGLTVLVPSYKEEIPVIRQTLLSAALQEYPNKRVVLLLDDPPSPGSERDQKALWAARTLPFDLQALLDEPFSRMTTARSAFIDRQKAGNATPKDECVSLSESFRWISDWLERLAKHTSVESHTDAWFTEHVLAQSGDTYRQQAAMWFSKRMDAPGDEEALFREIDMAYMGLADRFRVAFDVFERKQYCNLSHEPNKAMNLNSFLSLMGKRVRPILVKGEAYLQEVSTGGRLIPDTPYVITLDADSLLKSQYASTLIHLLEQPEFTRVAIAQTPYSAFPNAPGIVERTAGATTDIQFLVHQGFTRFGATFWVGANALLRKSALEEICTEQVEGTSVIRRYIQDRTVIEDTESTVDLLAKGWALHNYPDRLAYSATPPDFGSLIIQRARWANGGLIIFPKLLSFFKRATKQPQTLVQALLQTHYLTSLAFAPLSVLFLLCIPFSSELMSIWMPLAAIPYFALYARDLQLTGYGPIRDLIRVYALNLLLIPVHLTGAITSVRQALAGTKIPFRRTPKVSGRTRTSVSAAILQLLFVSTSAGLALYYVSQSRWISGVFALVNTGLLIYGIKQFIGFAEVREDLLFGLQERLQSWKVNNLTCRLQWSAIPGISWLRPYRAVLSVLLTVEVLSPTLVVGAQPSVNPIQAENQRPGTRAWILKNPAIHGEIEGYASATSVDQGEIIHLYVNTEAPTYSLTIYRMGWYGGQGARLVFGPRRYAGHQQPKPHHDADSGLIECQWERPIILTIPGGSDAKQWVSGYYLAKLTAEPTGEESYILFVVREDGRPSSYLVQASVTTFQAYNNWGGRSLYSFNSSGGQAAKVSFNRPYAGNPIPGAASGTGAGDFLVSNSIPSGYPASPAGWEYNMVRWLEKEGLDVTYATNIDIHANKALLGSHQAFLSIGHDEYWTWEMRRNVELARDLGTHLGILSSNTCYWQIRLETSHLTGQPHRTIVAYKENAPWNDPLYTDKDPGNDHLVTTRWRNPPVNRPEAQFLGTMYIEAENPIDGDYLFEDADAWLVKNTGLNKGSSLVGVAGYEVDGLSSASPASTRIIARMSSGSTTGAVTIYRAASGALVFASGSMQWSWGLDDYNAPQLRKSVVSHAVQEITRNILERFTRSEDYTGNEQTGNAVSAHP